MKHLTRQQIMALSDDGRRTVTNELLQAQVRYMADYVPKEVQHWDKDFVSDDGTDYVTSACDLVIALVSLRYEGTVTDLCEFLFGDHLWYFEGVSVQNAATDGICPELAVYVT